MLSLQLSARYVYFVKRSTCLFPVASLFLPAPTGPPGDGLWKRGSPSPKETKNTQQTETGGCLFTDQQTYFLTFQSHTYTILIKSESYRHRLHGSFTILPYYLLLHFFKQVQPLVDLYLLCSPYQLIHQIMPRAKEDLMSRQVVNQEKNTPVSRRGFIKGCTVAAAALGLSDAMVPKLVEAATSNQRPPVVWLHFQECTGCSESLLRASHPDIGRLILDIISLDYHETIMVAAGHQAEKSLTDTVSNYKGKFICVVEGGIPTKDGGIYCKIGNRTAMDLLADVGPKAAAVIAIGNCATFGGIQAAAPNPTGAVGVNKLLKDTPVINISGCPPNPICFLGTVLHYLTFKKMPRTDQLGRPLFAYGRKNHDHCERRAHFDEGRFVEQFGDEAHRLGYCLYKVGCKGPQTYANCPAVRFNDVNVWPVSVGHGCVGCTEPDFWDTMTPFYERLPNINIPGGGRGIVSGATSKSKVILGAAAAAVGIHAAIGIGKKIKGDKAED
jgi:hydrogenase small subunit/[NiFe] hydrogenase small subunit